MHDGIDVEFAEYSFEQRFVARVTDDQLARRYRRFKWSFRIRPVVLVRNLNPTLIQETKFNNTARDK